MAGSFLDTTVVVLAADPRSDSVAADGAQRAIGTLQPCEVAEYALRELLAGMVRILCDAHNALLAADNEGEAMLALLRLPRQQGRTREARFVAVAQHLADVYRANPTGEREAMRREMLDAFANRVARIWRSARRIQGVKRVQPLGCFAGGELSYGSAGELRGPGGSFGCDPQSRCAAAGYIHEDRITLTKLINALRPEVLSGAATAKNENSKRRKALKELESRGPLKFDKGRCRALGDAYFVAKCPPGSAILTTNISDFEPLCKATGKVARGP